MDNIFILIGNHFRENKVEIAGGAIFFEALIPKTFSYLKNSFLNNKALYYGDDFASWPQRLALYENKTFPYTNYQKEELNQTKLTNLEIESGILFKFNYTFVIIDGFYQRAFLPEKFKLEISFLNCNYTSIDYNYDGNPFYEDNEGFYLF